MTPVDLNRLREAREFDMTDRVQIERETAGAVLDAPTVWWCAELQVGGKDDGTFADGTCTVCGDEPNQHGCHLVNLVPVRGANDAT